VEELARQLNAWRNTLPPSLQWTDANRTSYVYYDVENSHPRSAIFTAQNYSLEERPSLQMYNADIVTAQLRCRFYYCQLMLFRPFLYKALHMPDQLTGKDAEYATQCLQSCLQWPICMGPLKDKKRLLPNTYVWTQSFIMILLLFKVAEQSSSLRNFFDENQHELNQSVRSMMVWLQDMKQVDALADWGSEILE
jgi:hypothetical protein